jgi:hypothetical protein
MTNGRNKGASWERTVASMIKENLGATVKRDLEQYRSGDRGDLIGLDGFVIECKRYKMANGGHHHQDWWHQVVNAASAVSPQTEPVLIYKYDRAEPKVVVRLSFLNDEYQGKPDTVTVSFDTWCMLVREYWASHVQA